MRQPATLVAGMLPSQVRRIPGMPLNDSIL